MQFYETQKFQAGERTFYGFGNPKAWILVIGNEPVFDFKDARIESAAARKYQRFTDGLTWRKRKTRFEYYNKIFFVDVRQIIEQDIWLTDSELIQAYYASEFENLLKSDFVKQFPIIIFSLEVEVWKYKIDISGLFNVKMQGGLVESCDKRQWYIMYKHKSKNKPRLVLHTRQISHKEANKEWRDMVSSAVFIFSMKYDFFIFDPDRDHNPNIPRQAYEFSDLISFVPRLEG